MPSVSPSKGSAEPRKLVSMVSRVQFIDEPALTDRIDHVELSYELCASLYPGKVMGQREIDTSDMFVMIKLLGAPDYFREFRICKVSSVNLYQADISLVTFVNFSEFAKFDNQLTITSCVVQTVYEDDIPLLENLFVSVPPNIYQILHEKPAASVRNLFISTYLRHTHAIAASGSTLPLINGEILLCEPVLQGRVDNNTKIILIKGSPVNGDSAIYEQNRDNSFDISQHGLYIPEINRPPELDLSKYLSSSLQFNEVDQEEPPFFKAKPLPFKMNVDGFPSAWNKEDPELFIFTNTRELAKMGFPVFIGDSVELRSENNSAVVKVFTFTEPNKFEQDTIYLSPILALNLGLSKTSRISFSSVTQKEKPLSELLSVAKSVNISRVASPISMDRTYQQHLFSELKTTFHERLKCFKQDDVFPIVVDTVLAKTMFDIGNLLSVGVEGYYNDIGTIPTGDPDAVAWFKIVDIRGDEEKDDTDGQFIIDPFKTRLISSGIEFKRIPPNDFFRWYEYLQLPPMFDYGIASEVYESSFKYASELKKIITTCLNAQAHVGLKMTVLLNSMTRGVGKASLVRSLACSMGLNLIEIDCLDLINPGAELKTIGLLQGKIEKILGAQEDRPSSDSSFHVIFLRHIENLCVQSNPNEQNANMSTSLTLKVVQTLSEYLASYSNLCVIFSCNDIDKLNDGVKLILKFQIDISVPEESERLQIFSFLIESETKKFMNLRSPEYTEHEYPGTLDIRTTPITRRKDVDYKGLALQSAGLNPKDLVSIVKKARQFSMDHLREISDKQKIPLKNIVRVGNGSLIVWQPDDFSKAINDARNLFSDSIGAPRIPNVKWEDVGGLDMVKGEILDTIDMPLKHPELFSSGLKKRSGILFYGPPGTGKTLLAKAIATNFSLNFFSVKGPELLNMYIGESEANVRRVFQRARDAKPCVIFFDELDSVAPKRGNQGDSGGVMDRIVSQLLAELDSMSGGEGGSDGVFVVGATNRPDLLDDALLRPGRFDKLLYLGISDTNEKQQKILEALTRKFNLHPDVDFVKVSENCSFTFTGADFYALCSDAMLNAMTRTANDVDRKISNYNSELSAKDQKPISIRWWFDNVATLEDTTVVVKMDDFVRAQNNLVPSVSAQELQHYLRVRQNFEGVDENGTKKLDKPEQSKQFPDDFIDGDIPVHSVRFTPDDTDTPANGH